MLEEPAEHPEDAREHGELLGNADYRIVARDVAGARQAMAAHLEGVAVWWRDHIARRVGPAPA